MEDKQDTFGKLEDLYDQENLNHALWSIISCFCASSEYEIKCVESNLFVDYHVNLFFDLELNSTVNVTKKLRNSASIDVADHYVIPVKSVEGQWIQHRNMFCISKRS